MGKYSQNLIKNLLSIDKNNHYFLYFTFFRQQKIRRRLIEKILDPLGKNVNIRVLPIPAAWWEFLTRTNFPIKKIIKDPLDVFFAPYASGIPKNSFSKTVFTCHDLVFLRFPEHRGKKLSNYYLKRHQIACRNSQKIIVPSLSTKNDLGNFLKIPPEKIVIIGEAADEKFKVIKDKKITRKIISKYFDPEISYFLSVGTLEPRKNLAKLVEAFARLPNAILKKYRLVLVGAQGWNNQNLLKTINNLNLKDKVIFPGFVSDEDLPYIYNQAAIFIYPSLYEGFGLPPLEAMACGTPSICSNISSMPEVVGKAGILINPNDEEEINQAIKKLILKPILRKKLALAGLKQAKKFSWKKTAKETLKVFKAIIH